jgi:hypothetical protein
MRQMGREAGLGTDGGRREFDRAGTMGLEGEDLPLRCRRGGQGEGGESGWSGGG